MSAMTPSSSPAGSTTIESPSISPQTDPPALDRGDPARAAEEVKERGNAVFKAGRYAGAIDLYTEAISKHAARLIALG